MLSDIRHPSINHSINALHLSQSSLLFFLLRDVIVFVAVSVGIVLLLRLRKVIDARCGATKHVGNQAIKAI